tara:strand:+ start:811 stop:1413 length:603 start_codon:yes stop_codon:yes gene_type:complete
MKELNEFLVKAADTVYALRFLRLLTMPAEKTAAFKTGVIDKDFKKLKKPETPDEKKAYTLFHRLVFNVKRLLRKVPMIGKATVSSYLAALWLIKDHTQMTDEELSKVLKEVYDIDTSDFILFENSMFINNDDQLIEGSYILNKNITLPITGEELVLKGSKVVVEENSNPYGTIFDTPVFKVYHPKTKNYVYITQGDIEDE